MDLKEGADVSNIVLEENRRGVRMSCGTICVDLVADMRYVVLENGQTCPSKGKMRLRRVDQGDMHRDIFDKVFHGWVNACPESADSSAMRCPFFGCRPKMIHVFQCIESFAIA